MAQVFGEFTEDFSGRIEFLVLRFLSSSLTIQPRWKTNSLAADFLGDYVKNFFLSDTSAALNTQTEIRLVVSFIANELLENAMKYSDKSAGKSIDLEVHLFRDRLIFLSKNSVHQDAIPKFQSYLQEITTGDIDEMYITQVEKNVSNDKSESSRLGYLTILMDYDAALGWKFEQVSAHRSITMVTTMVRLPL